MTETTNLALSHIAAAQSQKEVTHNEALDGLDAALCAVLAVSVSGGNATVTLAQLRRNAALAVTGAGTAGRTVTLAACKRLVVVGLDDASTEAVSVVVGSTSLDLEPGDTGLFHLDGTTNGLARIGGSGGGGGASAFTDLSDVPASYSGEGGKSVRVNAGATALEFYTPTTYASEAYVDTAVANLVASAPSALNTLDELAAALGDDASFAATVTTSLAAKAATTYVDAADSALDARVDALEAGTATASLDTLGSTQGQTLYRSGTAWTALNPGTAGHYLKSGGSGANPSWADPLGSELTVSVSGGNQTLTSAQFVGNVSFLVSGASASGRTVTIPTGIVRLFIVSGDVGNANSISVVNGSTSFSVAPNTASVFFTDGGANSLRLVQGGLTTAYVTSAVAAASFTSIAETPDSFSGAGSQLVRVNSGASALEFASIASALDSVGSTRGAILYRGATAWSALAPGTSGYVLTSNGSGADPSYAAVSAGSPSNPLTLTAATGVPVQLLAAGADTNHALILQPKGNGAIQAQLATSSSAGGNTRGTNAVDWSTLRNNAAEVASGSYSTVGGGKANRATNTGATAPGGESNTASGSYSFAVGNAGTASGTYSVCLGAFGTSSATGSAVGGGESNKAQGSYATTAGGYQNELTGDYSWCPGGRNARGQGVKYKGAWGLGFLPNGDAGTGAFEQVIGAYTTNATATVLTSDNASAAFSNQIGIPNHAGMSFRLMVTARQRAAGGTGVEGDMATWNLDVVAKRDFGAGTTAIKTGGGSSIAPTWNDTSAAAWRIAVEADTSNGAVKVTATGEASKPVYWTARVVGLETIGS